MDDEMDEMNPVVKVLLWLAAVIAILLAAIFGSGCALAPATPLSAFPISAFYFSQITPPVQLAAWLGCLAFVVMLANGLIRLWRSLKDKPAPGEVRDEAHRKFIAKEAFAHAEAEHKKVHEQLFAKIGGVERGARDHFDRRLAENEFRADVAREKLHVRINRISVGVARLCGRLNVEMPEEDAEI
jgi:ABC-type nickel/cobalt efflux system permease component RcnA